MTDQSDNAASVRSEPMPPWRWAYRLLRVVVMLLMAYWLSNSGDAFFYQGF